MTWRRFGVLLRGLSPHSATVAKLTSGREFGRKREAVSEVRGARAAQAAFDSIFAAERAASKSGDATV